LQGVAETAAGPLSCEPFLRASVERDKTLYHPPLCFGSWMRLPSTDRRA
jgi:hypothetical protein